MSKPQRRQQVEGKLEQVPKVGLHAHDDFNLVLTLACRSLQLLKVPEYPHISHCSG